MKAHFSNESFNFSKKLINCYENKRDEKILVLNGKLGTGKTKNLITFLTTKCLNAILTKDLNRFRDLNYSNKAIILNDMDLSKLSSKKSLLDKTRDSEVRVLYEINKLKKIIPNFYYFQSKSRN